MIDMIILLLIVLFVGSYFAMSYNEIVSLTNYIKNSWSNVLVQFQQNTRTVEKMEELLKDHVGFEKDFITKIIGLREQAGQLSQGDIDVKKLNSLESEMKSGLSGLKVTVEAYPDIKSSEMYSSLMNEVAEQQDNIASSFKIFNSNVNLHNTYIKSFPSVIVNNLINKRHEVDFFQTVDVSNSTTFKPNL
jgi:LemA protein